MKSKPMKALFGVLALVAVLAIAPSAFAQESSATVNISAGAGSGPDCSQSNNCFSPDVINVAPGTTVTWNNNDKVSHTVTSGNPSDNQTGTIFDSSLIPAGHDFTFTFNNPGTYHYFCQVHPWMSGEVIVGAAAPTQSSTQQAPSSNMTGMSNMTTASTNTTTSQPTTAPVQTSQPTTAPVQTSQPTTAPVQTSQPTTAASTDQSAVVQQLGLTPADDPIGPLQSVAWVSGMIVAAAMSGIGIWSAARRR
ncbi:MAG: cupredoxin domain-containing protein [Thaumarchaeota archaeon]|nr:cupredoxin domain-containing protein [Nitrososphaerota archaeon]